MAGALAVLAVGAGIVYRATRDGASCPSQEEMNRPRSPGEVTHAFASAGILLASSGRFEREKTPGELYRYSEGGATMVVLVCDRDHPECAGEATSGARPPGVPPAPTLRLIRGFLNIVIWVAGPQAPAIALDNRTLPVANGLAPPGSGPCFVG